MTRFEPIVTQRLVLRPLEACDRARLIELANNWRVAKNLSQMPYPYTAASADDWLGKQASLWAGGKCVNVAITLDGQFIGGAGVSVRDHGVRERPQQAWIPLHEGKPALLPGPWQGGSLPRHGHGPGALAGGPGPEGTCGGAPLRLTVTAILQRSGELPLADRDAMY
jgi:hypothetical protein